MPRMRFVKDIDIQTSTTRFKHDAGDVVELSDARAKHYGDLGYCVPAGTADRIAADLKSGAFVGLTPRGGKTLTDVGLPVPGDAVPGGELPKPPVDAATTDAVLGLPVPTTDDTAGTAPGGLPAPTQPGRGGRGGGRRGS